MDDERNLPVLASQARPIEPVQPAPLSAPAAAAAGGFLAGLVTLILVRAARRPGRRALIFRRRKTGVDRALEIASSRSFLVDVHLVKR